MPAQLTRIISDIHFGDPASYVKNLTQIQPLLGGVDHLILNGDTLDTRPGGDPQLTRSIRTAITNFFNRRVPRVTYITGNHDPDFSSQHHLDLANGQIFIIHGDVFFEELVPWSQDAPLIRLRLAEELRHLPSALHHHLDHRIALCRRVAGSIPQRHQSEKNVYNYAARYLSDTIWPPTRAVRILSAWRANPKLAGAFAQTHRPHAKFIISGHTHRPGVWPSRIGATVINTGSFALALGSIAADLSPSRLTIRAVKRRAGEFHPGAPIAEFPLAEL